MAKTITQAKEEVANIERELNERIKKFESEFGLKLIIDGSLTQFGCDVEVRFEGSSTPYEM